MTWRLIWGLLRREVLVVSSQPADAFLPLIFFFIGVVLLAFVFNPASAPIGLVWLLALLALLLSLEGLFLDDFRDESLHQMLFIALPLEVVVLVKCLCHWLFAALPLMAGVLMAAWAFDLVIDQPLLLLFALALGMVSLVLIGALGASLMIGARGGGAMLALLVLPLQIPVLIFGSSLSGALVVDAQGVLPVTMADHIATSLSMLAGLALIGVAIIPWLIALQLRAACSD